MRSVADDLRREQIARLSTLTMSDRITLAVRLGEEAARTYAHVHGISEPEAKRVLQRQRQRGRRPSACHDALLA